MVAPTALPGAETTFRSPSEERRATIRYPVRRRASCRNASEGPSSWKALVRDLSSLGIGLVVGEGFAPGTVLELDVETSVPGKVRSLLARVVHTEPMTGGDWIIGCAFVHELSDAELQVFQVQRVKPPRPDERRWVRFPCNVETVCYTCETVPGEQARARIVNISPGGIGLLLPCEFGKGTLLNFELPGASGRPALKVLVRVVRSMEHGNGDWFLGCEFVCQLSSAQLREFLG